LTGSDRQGARGLRSDRYLRVGKANVWSLPLLLLLATSAVALLLPVSGAFAQSQAVTAAPGNINLGMNTSITLTAPSAGTYSIVVRKPAGELISFNMTFAGSGAPQSATFGNGSVGFKSAVDETGTYNVFVEQGAQVLYTTSFYATNQMVIKMDMVNGGLCYYIQDAPRGSAIFPRFFVYYLSDGSSVTNLQLANVSYTLPGGALANATWHKPGVEGVGFFIGKILPNWNYTYVGPYYPNATATDNYGNMVNFTYRGRPFLILPVQLLTDAQFIDTKANATVTSLYSGESISVNANVTYSDTEISGIGAVAGFVAPLDTSRGGTVTAFIGWGSFNTTTNAFGGAQPGGLLGSVQLTYSQDNGTWVGQFNAPSLPSGASGYKVVIVSGDSASPANSGSEIVELAPANAPAAATPMGSLTFSQVLITVVAVLIVGLAAGIITSPIRQMRGKKP
jgi:hypothetical protein